MRALNYFQILCLFWAALGIGSRLLMALLGKRWKQWELNSAYSAQKPKWLYVVGILGLALIAYTWYAVFTMAIPYSWIMAVFVSLTAVKIFMLLFRYEQFRAFVAMMLNSREKMLRLNIAVFVYSVVCIIMAVFIY